MSDLLNALQRPIITGRPDTVQPGSPTRTPKTEPGGKTFEQVLRETLTTREPPKQLTLSKHARLRAEQRNISLNQADMQRLDQAVSQASDKGVSDTLILMNNMAFIVNVPQKVIVTMMDPGQQDPVVVTNIDGAVIL